MAMEIKNPQGGPSQRQTGTAVWHEWKLLATGRISLEASVMLLKTLRQLNQTLPDYLGNIPYLKSTGEGLQLHKVPIQSHLNLCLI